MRLATENSKELLSQLEEGGVEGQEEGGGGNLLPFLGLLLDLLRSCTTSFLLLSCSSFSFSFSFFSPLLYISPPLWEGLSPKAWLSALPWEPALEWKMATPYRNGNSSLVPKTMAPKALVELPYHHHPLRHDSHIYLSLDQVRDQRGLKTPRYDGMKERILPSTTMGEWDTNLLAFSTMKSLSMKIP